MTLLTDNYYSIKCNAAVDNPLHPTCEMISAGGYNDKVAVVEAALKTGWTEDGGKHRCPTHSQQDTVVPTASPRKPRPVKPVVEQNEAPS